MYENECVQNIALFIFLIIFIVSFISFSSGSQFQVIIE